MAHDYLKDFLAFERPFLRETPLLLTAPVISNAAAAVSTASDETAPLYFHEIILGEALHTIRVKHAQFSAPWPVNASIRRWIFERYQEECLKALLQTLEPFWSEKNAKRIISLCSHKEKWRAELHHAREALQKLTAQRQNRGVGEAEPLDINACDAQGDTLLGLLLRWDAPSPDLFRLLLVGGADPYFPNIDGETPKQYLTERYERGDAAGKALSKIWVNYEEDLFQHPLYPEIKAWVNKNEELFSAFAKDIRWRAERYLAEVDKTNIRRKESVLYSLCYDLVYNDEITAQHVQNAQEAIEKAYGTALNGDDGALLDWLREMLPHLQSGFVSRFTGGGRLKNSIEEGIAQKTPANRKNTEKVLVDLGRYVEAELREKERQKQEILAENRRKDAIIEERDKILREKDEIIAQVQIKSTQEQAERTRLDEERVILEAEREEVLALAANEVLELRKEKAALLAQSFLSPASSPAPSPALPAETIIEIHSYCNDLIHYTKKNGEHTVEVDCAELDPEQKERVQAVLRCKIENKGCEAVGQSPHKKIIQCVRLLSPFIETDVLHFISWIEDAVHPTPPFPSLAAPPPYCTSTESKTKSIETSNAELLTNSELETEEGMPNERDPCPTEAILNTEPLSQDATLGDSKEPDDASAQEVVATSWDFVEEYGEVPECLRRTPLQQCPP